MLAASLLVAALVPVHLIGAGGLIGPPEPVLAVSAPGQDRSAPVHGWFSWEYGAGLDELLGDSQQLELQELRQRHVGLSSAAAACAVVGSTLTVVGLYLTPNFVNVDQPDTGGLVIPIVMGSLGAVVGLAAIPLVYFLPGDVEIETLVSSHNSDTEEGARLKLSREVIPGATLTLVRDETAGVLP